MVDFGFDGEFAGAAPAVVESQPKPEQKVETPAPTPQVFRKEIDLGDGSGKQVFEADSSEALLEKLVDAQKHATAKIRQLNRQLKNRPVAQQKQDDVQYRQFTAEEEAILAQELANRPSQVISKIIEGVTGYKPEKLHEALKKANEAQKKLAEREAAELFVIDHIEDYNPTPQNFSKIKTFLDGEGLDFSRENLEYAFTELSASGLLAPPKKANPVAETRIEATATGQKVVATGLSSRSSAAEPVADDVAQTVEELQKLPIEAARQRIVELMHRQRIASRTPR